MGLNKEEEEVGSHAAQAALTVAGTRHLLRLCVQPVDASDGLFEAGLLYPALELLGEARAELDAGALAVVTLDEHPQAAGGRQRPPVSPQLLQGRAVLVMRHN